VTRGWIDPRHLGAVLALLWAKSHAEASAEPTAVRCRDCFGTGATVFADGHGTTYLVRCGVYSGTGTTSRLTP
jgi:hypothetical protein